jgi:acyl-[acyl carrier protein]--UDP-N-acetylglucosamine O-acyltransferase
MISPQAIVQTKSIGKNVRIDEFAITRPDVVLGDGVVIHPYGVIERGRSLEMKSRSFRSLYR